MCSGPFDFLPDLNFDGKKDVLDLMILDAILEDEEETEAEETDIFADDDDLDDVDDFDSDFDDSDDDWDI